MTRFVLLLPCSKAKREDAGEIPAFDRYNGPLYQVLHKRAREEWPALYPARQASVAGPPPALEVLILSAQYGLIEAATPIAWYDRKLDRPRAAELLPAVTRALIAHTKGLGIGDRLLYYPCHFYALLIPPAWLHQLRNGGVVVETIGGWSGQCAAQLRRWLLETAAARRFEWEVRLRQPAAEDDDERARNRWAGLPGRLVAADRSARETRELEDWEAKGFDDKRGEAPAA